MPTPGNFFDYEGQRYTCVAVETAKNLQERDCQISRWEGQCAVKGCPGTFLQSFGPNWPNTATRLNRRCRDHAAPGVPVSPRHPMAPRPSALVAIEWLVRFRVEAGGPLATSDFLRIARSCTETLPPMVRTRLGCTAKTLGSSRQAVIRTLRTAERLGALKRAADGTSWDLTQKRIERIERNAFREGVPYRDQK